MPSPQPAGVSATDECLRLHASCLLPPYQADTRSERPPLAGREGWRGMTGVDHAVHIKRIAASGDVVETSAHSEIVAEQMKPLFQLCVQRKVPREAVGSGSADELLLIG